MYRTLFLIRRTTLLLLFVLCFQPLAASADELEFVATKDSTLYESTTGSLANGAGSFLFAGRTGQTSRGIRRLLLSFDLTALPTNAAITAAELTMSVVKGATSSATDFPLHRMLSTWGEGDSDASTLGEGQGIAALDGEATWIHSVKPDAIWETPGGDFADTVSATTELGFEANYSWSGDGMIEDVQLWRDDPASNHGWIMLSDESTSRTARQFVGRTNEDVANRPTLRVTFDIAGGLPIDCNGDGVVDANDLSCVCSEPAAELSDLLDQLGLIAGDFNADGDVGFLDFLQLSSRFNEMGDYADGDFNCDGEIGFEDFLGLSMNFGQSSEVSAAVPEPNTSTILLAGLLLVFIGLRSVKVRSTDALMASRARVSRSSS